jgi:hypothetical protein
MFAEFCPNIYHVRSDPCRLGMPNLKLSFAKAIQSLLQASQRPIVNLIRAVLFIVATAFAVVFSGSARADLTPLNGAAVAPNIAEITIREDGVYIALEVYVGDFGTFRELLPNEFLNSDTSERPPLAERLRRFSDQRLQVIADGTKLIPELLLAEPRARVDRAAALAAAGNPLSTLPIPEAPDDDRVLYVEMKYPFETRPDSLVFVPPPKPNGSPKVSIGFVVFHETVPVIDFRYLCGPETQKLVGEYPCYSLF